MASLDEMSVVPGAWVRWLARQAEVNGLNRQLPRELQLKVESKGWSVFHIVVPFHDRGRAGDVAHHRCQALLKLEGQEAPEVALMDVLARDWEKMPPADMVKRLAAGVEAVTDEELAALIEKEAGYE